VVCGTRCELAPLRRYCRGCSCPLLAAVEPLHTASASGLGVSPLRCLAEPPLTRSGTNRRVRANSQQQRMLKNLNGLLGTDEIERYLSARYPQLEQAARSLCHGMYRIRFTRSGGDWPYHIIFGASDRNSLIVLGVSETRRSDVERVRLASGDDDNGCEDARHARYVWQWVRIREAGCLGRRGLGMAISRFVVCVCWACPRWEDADLLSCSCPGTDCLGMGMLPIR
jgi:hypothetical protein